MRNGEIIELGPLVIAGRLLGTLRGLCLVEDLSTLTESALLEIEHPCGEVTLMILPVGNA